MSGSLNRMMLMFNNANTGTGGVGGGDLGFTRGTGTDGL